MSHDKEIRIKRKSWVKHSRPRSRWVDLLPFLALGLCCLVGLAYLTFCFLTPSAPVNLPPANPHPTAAAPPPAADHSLVNSK